MASLTEERLVGRTEVLKTLRRELRDAIASPRVVSIVGVRVLENRPSVR